MHIRPATPADLERLPDIDGTIESTDYLHLERLGEGLSVGWKLEQRPLRSKLIEANPLNDEQQFLLKQVAIEMTGGDTHRHSNHDMVKESATIFWYAPLE